MKATKKTPAVLAAPAPAAPKSAPIDTVVLDPVQMSAVDAVVRAARSVESSKRDAAVAIRAVQEAGVPAAYGLTLGEWVVRHLSSIGIAKSTAYYLAEVGQGYTVLGTERADSLPMEGLRVMVAKAKRQNRGDATAQASAIRTFAKLAEESIQTGTDRLKACRDAVKPEEPTDPAQKIEASVSKLAKVAIAESGEDLLVAIDLLKRAAVRVDAMEKARQKAEAAKA